MADVTVTFTTEQLQGAVTTAGLSVDVAAMSDVARDVLAQTLVTAKMTSTLAYPRGRQFRNQLRSAIGSIDFGGPDGLFVTRIDNQPFVTLPYTNTIVFGADVKELVAIMDEIPGYEGQGWETVVANAQADTSQPINLGGGIEAQMFFVYNFGPLRPELESSWAAGPVLLFMLGLVHPGLTSAEAQAYATAHFTKANIVRGNDTISTFTLDPWSTDVNGLVMTMVMDQTFAVHNWVEEVHANPSQFTFVLDN